MAYNSAHTGPEIDAAVQQLGQIQEAREATNQDRLEVKDLAAQVKVDAGQVSSQADSVSAKATQVAANATAVEQARAQVVDAAEAAESAMDAAVLSAASAEESQAAASVSEQAAAQSQLAAGLSEQVSAEHATEATSAAAQVASDRAAAEASAASAASSAQNAEAVVTGGTASVIPNPGLIPLADAQGKIDADWLPEEVARTESVQAALEASAEAVNAASEARSRTASFLQPSPEAPVIRDDGSPLQVGDRYFNSLDQSEWIYTEDGWAINDSLAAIDSIKDATDPSRGGREVGYDGASVSDMLDLARPFAGYGSLRNYAGFAKVAEIKESGVAGLFLRDDTDRTSSDDGGTVIIDFLSRRWKRSISSRVSVRWFGAPSTTVDQTSAFSAASAAASRRASGLAGDVDVPAGNWIISQPIPQAANWYLDGAATISGQPTVGSETVPIHDTSYLTGRITDFRAGSAAQLRLGDPDPWLTKIYRPISECITTASFINDRGRPALLAATRTSGNSGGAALGYAASFTCVNDKIDGGTVGGWSGYTETYKIGDAGTTLGHEWDFVNTGSTIDLGPYSNLNTGITVNAWFVCGGGSTPLAPLAQNISAHIAMAPNQKGANRGIVVRNGAVSGVEKEALALPDAHKLAWYASDNVRLSYIDETTQNRLSRSATATDCITDISRRRNGTAAVSTSNGTKAYRHEQQAFNGTSYMTAAFQEVVQQTAFASGTARFAYIIAAHNVDGTTASWSLNKISGNTFGPDNDAASNFAGPSNRINNSYLAVAPTVTSDERDKDSIQKINDAVLDAWQLVEYTQYKLKDAIAKKGDSARWHFGLIAQRIKDAFESVGIDPFEYGLLCHDSWEAQYEEVPAEYEVVEAVFSDILGSDGKPFVIKEASRRLVSPPYQKEVIAAGERYGIRYEEAICLESALLRRAVARIQERMVD